MQYLRVVLIKPSKYALDGNLERFEKGFMPNATLFHIGGLTPRHVRGVPVELHLIDEYIWTSLDYLHLLESSGDYVTLLAIVGVQSHQFHRALDLAAYAQNHGTSRVVIGGPHVMTCDTSQFQNKGVAFSLAEAELVWPQILQDALSQELEPVYGENQRWAKNLEGSLVHLPSENMLTNYWAPMLGLYPVRGCPYKCNFCSVIKISGRSIRNPSIELTLENIRRAKAAGISTIMFVSDNFNKFPEVSALLEAIIKENLGIRFFCQCDAQIAKEPQLIELLRKAGCFEIFVGVESFKRSTLKKAHKYHNQPDQYGVIASMCREANIRAHFSNIIGFPDDNASDIYEHLELLKEMLPKVASFYILTPIPGTEQYDDFFTRDIITERNLDRFDALSLVWKHPKIDAREMQQLLFHAYVDFYRHLLKVADLTTEEKDLAIFNRYSASRHLHPMSGGIRGFSIDHQDDYLQARLAVFGIDFAPLPISSKLSAVDEQLNRHAKI